MNIDDDREFLELEDELSGDDDTGDEILDESGDYEGDLEAISAYEVGSLGELDEPQDEDELDEPWQVEFEELGGGSGDFELEMDLGEEIDDEEAFGFLKKIGRGLGRVVKKGARALGRIAGSLFKKLAPIAARIVGGAIGGPAGAAIGNTIAKAVLREGEMETEAATEAEFERSDLEFEELGGDPESYEAMQEYARDMSEADSEHRVNRSFVALARQAARTFRRNRRLRPVIPLVLRAALALTKTFRKNRRTRGAIGTIPLIIRRALTRLARSRQIDRRAVVVAMSRETAWVLANQRRAKLALRRGRSSRRSRRRRGRALREELVY